MKDFLRGAAWFVLGLIVLLICIALIALAGVVMVLGGIIIALVSAIGAVIQGDDMIETVYEALEDYWKELKEVF